MEILIVISLVDSVFLLLVGSSDKYIVSKRT